MAAVALVAAALGTLAYRSLDAASRVAAKPVPAADLETLTPFLGPLDDSASLAGRLPNSMLGNPDPFAAAPGVGTTSGNAPVLAGQSSVTSARQHWVVSSILFEASKRSAIVNNAWVSVGDAIGGGARVTAIERKHVIITDAKGIRHVVPIQGGAE